MVGMGFVCLEAENPAVAGLSFVSEFPRREWAVLGSNQ